MVTPGGPDALGAFRGLRLRSRYDHDVPQTESLFITGPVGRLEAILMYPKGEVRAAAVVCHANPLQGGMMHFKVVFRAAKALQAAGLAVLRFNFRGVGLSEGSHDHGRGEQEDVRAALDEMERRHPGKPVVLGGFSFGSVMALAVSGADDRPRAVFALGLPVKLDAMVGRVSSVAHRRVPRLFVQGENDRFGGELEIRDVVASFPEPKELIVVPAADHFFTDRLDAVQAAVESWASRHPWEAA